MLNELTKALIIKKEWLDLILSGKKTLEIRGMNTKNRGLIGLIESGSGLVVGTCEIVGSHTLDCEHQMNEALEKGCIPNKERITNAYNKPHAWEIENAKRLDSPIKYKHPKGAIIWIVLEGSVIDAIQKQFK